MAFKLEGTEVMT